MRLLDVHSHILPFIDDGAQDIEESVQLLTILKNQGVTDVFATPHFSPSRDSTEEFFSRLKKSADIISEAVRDKELPNIFYGCEVLYTHGIGSFEGMKNFTISGSRYLLLEFFVGSFDENVLDDIVRLKEEQNIIPIIAHTERYKDVKGYKKLLRLISKGYCKAQVNAESVVKGYYSKAAHKLIKAGLVSFIGSDCHSVEKRAPHISEAYKVISKKFGREVAIKLIQNGEKILAEVEKTVP